MTRADSAGSGEALVGLLVIAAATVLIYSNTFDASFHFDDMPNIVENGSLRDLRTQWPPLGSRYLGYLSFALNYRFGGLGVFGYHLVNLLIHVCNGLLVFWLTASTLRTPALRGAEAGPLVRRYLPVAAGLIFAVHPVQTQAVTYIVQRFASLATLFYLLSLVLYARARLSLEAGHPSKARTVCLYGLSVVAAAAAMKTKEISLTLPLVAAGYELLFFRSGRRRLLLVAPLAATALLVPLGVAAQGKSLAAALDDASHGFGEAVIPRSVYLLTQSRVVVTYLRLLVLPIRQNVDYDYRLSRSLTDPSVLFAIAILLAVVASAVVLLIRARWANRAAGVLVFFGIAWLFVTSSVESSVIPIRDVIFEHRIYLPSVGAAIALGTALLWGVERLRSRTPLALQCTAALIVTAGPLGAATYARNIVWKDEVALWSDVVAKSPGKARPHSNLGYVYLHRGRTSDAVSEFLAVLKISPGYVDALNNLGAAYITLGRTDEAIAALEKKIALEPYQADAHDNLGVAFQKRGRLDDAIREHREAIWLDPLMALAHYNLGVACGAKGQLDDAIRELREAIRLDPGFAMAHYSLGLAYEEKGRLDDAMSERRQAMRLVGGAAR